MTTTTAISGNPQKNNGATVLMAGNIDSSDTVTRNLTQNELAYTSGYGSSVSESVGETHKPLTAGVFGKMETGQYVAKILGTRVAQTDETFLRGGGAETNARKMLHYSSGYRRLHHTAWDYVTGAVTKGGNAGDAVTFTDPADGTTIAKEPYPTDAVPGELTYHTGSSEPTTDEYKPRTG